MAQIAIDGKALRDFVRGSGDTLGGVSEELGRGPGYISTCIYAGAMNDNAYRLLLRKYGLDDGAFAPKKEEPKKPEPTQEEGPYSLTLQVKPDRVCVGLIFNGEELYHAWAKVKGSEEVDLVQSISYAAHMVYKMAEQDALANKKKSRLPGGQTR